MTALVTLPVADAVTVAAGFSNGFAGTLTLAGGARVFVKAISDRMMREVDKGLRLVLGL